LVVPEMKQSGSSCAKERLWSRKATGVQQSAVLWYHDKGFKDVPFISTGRFNRFQAGMALIENHDCVFGPPCLMDFKPREFDFDASEAIRRLARLLERPVILWDIRQAQENPHRSAIKPNV
jgi:hypothetical protein